MILIKLSIILTSFEFLAAAFDLRISLVRDVAKFL
jgi:hypothetical protein